MLKQLPILFFSTLLLLVFSFRASFAQSTSVVNTSGNPPGTVNIRIAEDSDPIQIDDSTTPTIGDWIPDSTVTFVGKTANRAGDFLDWTIRNYDWTCVKTNSGSCTSSGNPLVGFWALIRNIVYALLIILVLIAAFVMIITRGRNLTITRFIPRFIFIIILVTLSYALIQLIYQVTDIIQGFFLRTDGKLISTKDLIFIGFDYKNFEGARRYGAQYDESAFITLLLVRLTALTYYVMTGVLLVRKIILWFFIILSPVFPLLLFFKPVRNTGKIWVGEFFRWLLYAPLFAIFLQGLVVLWKSKGGIPLAFDFANVGDVIYPTAVNILIGGPGQKIFFDTETSSNSVNLQDTFALYIVALLMLWVVIILPFLLLKIFLDYLGGLSLQDNITMKRLLNRGSEFLPISRPPTPSSSAPLPPSQGAGRAMQIPFNTSASRSVSDMNRMSSVQANRSIASIPVNAQILQLANLSVPKMRDIARFETSMVTNNSSKMQDISRLKTSLTRISNPTTITAPLERERYTQVKQQLISEKQKGNVLASSILTAANTTAAPYQKGMVSSQQVHLPQANKVQQVSIEDYEEVRKMWQDTYQNSTPPTDLSGKKDSREEWIKGDIDKINQAITLLNSVDPVRTQEGMDMVSNILPFLMIGGFSKTEVIAYLKAKLEAAKDVLSSTSKKNEEDDTMMDRDTKATIAEKHMNTHAEAEIPTIDDGTKKLEDLRKQGQ